jgi:hypothetical protein
MKKWLLLLLGLIFCSVHAHASSSVGSATDTACSGCVATPVVVSSGGTVTITDATPGAGIWYTTDGSTPTLPPGGVPQGTSTSYTPMCNPVVQPPLADLKNITAYGALAGGRDNTTAIYNACVAAGPAQAGGPAAQTSGIYIPAGVWYAGNFVYGNTPLNCNIYGQGFTSEIYCPSSIVGGNNCQMYSTGSNEVWSYFQHNIVWTTRDASNFNLSHNAGSNNRIDTVLLIGADGGGMQNNGDSGGINTNNGVFHTGADCNYHLGGTFNDVTDHTYVYDCGDDSVSLNGYSGSAATNNILVQWNTLNSSPANGDGVGIYGTTNATVKDNYIYNSGSSGITIQQEPPADYPFDSSRNIILAYNWIENSALADVSQQGGIGMWSCYPGAGGLSSILIEGNYINGFTTGNGGLTTSDCTGSVFNGITYLNNTMANLANGPWDNIKGSGNIEPTNVACNGNTYNGAASSGSQCTTSTVPSTLPTGSTLSYSGCVVGTAVQYTDPFTTSGNVKAVAVFPGLTNSAIGSGFVGPTTATPTFSPASESFSSPISLTLSDSTSGSTIYYEIEGSPLPVIVNNQVPTVVTTVGPSITDASGYVWTITSGGQMAINGNTIAVTGNVVEIAYINGKIWQRISIDTYWYEVTSVVSTTVPTVNFGAATTTSPIPTPQSITDTHGYVWTITSSAKMAINGNVITDTAEVVELVYVNGQVWQLNSPGNWYDVLSVTSPTVPTVTFGYATTTSPIPSYSVYISPLLLSSSTSVSAYANAPGYSNSGVVTGIYTLSANGTPATRTVVSGYIRPKSGAATMTTGSTMQLIAYVTYSDGSTGTLPDAQGNVVTWWNTTNHAVAKISSHGHATALAAGSINMEARVGALTLTPWAVNVGTVAPDAAIGR